MAEREKRQHNVMRQADRVKIRLQGIRPKLLSDSERMDGGQICKGDCGLSRRSWKAKNTINFAKRKNNVAIVQM